MEAPHKVIWVTGTANIDLGLRVPNKGSAWKVVGPPSNLELSRIDIMGQDPSFNEARIFPSSSIRRAPPARPKA